MEQNNNNNSNIQNQDIEFIKTKQNFPKKKKNEIFINNQRSNYKTLYSKKIIELFSTFDTVLVYGLGAALEKAVNVALSTKDILPDIEISEIKTETVTHFDKYFSRDNDNLIKQTNDRKSNLIKICFVNINFNFLHQLYECFLFSAYHYLNITTAEELEKMDLKDLDPALQEDLNVLNTNKEQYKEISCLLLIRNSLKEGNSKIKEVVNQHPNEKENAFDQVIIHMLNECKSKISEEEILVPENVLSLDENKKRLIDFNVEYFKDSSNFIEFNEEALNIIEIMKGRLTKGNSEDEDDEDEDYGLNDETKNKNIKLDKMFYLPYMLGLIVILLIITYIYLFPKKEDRFENENKTKKKKN